MARPCRVFLALLLLGNLARGQDDAAAGGAADAAGGGAPAPDAAAAANISCPIAGNVAYNELNAVSVLLLAQGRVDEAEACLVQAVLSTLTAYKTLSDIALARGDTGRAAMLAGLADRLDGTPTSRRDSWGRGARALRAALRAVCACLVGSRARAAPRARRSRLIPCVTHPAQLFPREAAAAGGRRCRRALDPRHARGG